MNKYGKITLNGLVTNNATFKLVLGTCATLGLSSSAMNGLGMGLSLTAVLLLSNVVISLLRKLIPSTVRIPAFIVIIATMVTLLRMFLFKFLPDLYEAMGVFLPLIVVNCMILGRAEAFASKQPVLDSAVDGVATGLGFTAALTVMGIIRELLGNGSFFDIKLWDFTIGFFSNSAGADIMMNLGFALLYALFAGVGFTLAMVLMGGVRERVEKLPVAKCAKGFPITMIIASFMAMAFYVFTLIAF